MRSILQKEKVCFVTERTDNLQDHHIFFGTGLRKISEKNGFKVWLTGEYHNQDSRKDVHHNRWLDLYLKRACQGKFEETHSRAEFMKLIGQNYVWEDVTLAWLLEMALSEELYGMDS